jgi:serine/threonine-protein kinase
MATSAAGVPFGPYILLKRLAVGGMAEIFLARRKTNLAPLVLKRVLPEYAEDPIFLRMFLNEARIAALLNHPGIIRILALGREQEQYFIAMEYIDGVDLGTVLTASGGRLRPELAADIGERLCDALFYANRMVDPKGAPLNIIHRDVTPGNVMITRGGGVKLVDFGIAKATVQFERTRPGVVKGKFRFMSPEQLDEVPLDGRSDLFSLGVLLYEAVTGVRLFESREIVKTLLAVKTHEPPPPHGVLPEVPRALSQIIMKALEKDRDRRYRTAQDMKRDLTAFLDGVAPQSDDLAGMMRTLFPAEPAAVEAREEAPSLPVRSRPEVRTKSPPDDAADPFVAPVTEALPPDQVARMLAEADRRAALKKASPTQEAPASPSAINAPDTNPERPYLKQVAEADRRAAARHALSTGETPVHGTEENPALGTDENSLLGTEENLLPADPRHMMPSALEPLSPDTQPPRSRQSQGAIGRSASAIDDGESTTGKHFGGAVQDRFAVAAAGAPRRSLLGRAVRSETSEGDATLTPIGKPPRGRSQKPVVARDRRKARLALGVLGVLVLAGGGFVCSKRFGIRHADIAPEREVEVPSGTRRGEDTPRPPATGRTREGTLQLTGRTTIAVSEGGRSVCESLPCEVALQEGTHVLTAVEDMRSVDIAVQMKAGQRVSRNVDIR